MQRLGAPKVAPDVRGAAAVAATFSGRARTARPALVNGSVGAAWAPDGTPRAVFTFTIARGKIVAIDVVADPGRLRQLEVVRRVGLKTNQCPFCVGVHSAAVEAMLGSDITTKVLENYRTAPIEEKLRATLALLEKVTLDHEHLSAEDVRPALAAGVSQEAIADAVYVAFLFNVFNRLADTLAGNSCGRSSTPQSVRCW